MNIGSKVVCIDDVFPDWVHRFYIELPVKGSTYTIREMSVGRGHLGYIDKDGKPIINRASDLSGGEVRVLLEELHNGPDPFCVQRELGFKAERFRLIEEQESTEQHSMGEVVHGTS